MVMVGAGGSAVCVCKNDDGLVCSTWVSSTVEVYRGDAATLHSLITPPRTTAPQTCDSTTTDVYFTALSIEPARTEVPAERPIQ